MKRRSFVTLLATATALRAQESPASSPAESANLTFTIAGAVVNALTNAPVSRALVQISPTRERNATLNAVTGPDGRFSFSNLAAAKFSLTVTHGNDGPQGYLANGSYSTAIVTGPNQETNSIVFRLRPSGSLTGTVVDENNEPVRNCTVMIYSQQVGPTGMLGMFQVRGASTGNSGRFHAGHLHPGNYLIALTGTPWYATRTPRYQQLPGVRSPIGIGAPPPPVYPPSVIPADPQFDVVYPLTYYPGTTDLSAAAAIPVTEGNESQIQVALHAVPSIHVRLIAPEGKPESSMSVQASALGPANRPIAHMANAMLQNGHGELSGLAAGRYQLSLNSSSMPQPEEGITFGRGMAGGPRSGRGGGETLRKVVDLVDGATVDLGGASRLKVTAKVIVAGEQRPQNRIALQLRDPATGQGALSQVGENDLYHFPDNQLTSGRYELILPNTPAFHILSVEVKGAKVLGNQIQLEEAGDVQLAVSIAPRSATTIQGFAVRDDQPLVGAMVLLVPKNLTLGTSLYRDQSDSDGSYGFERVAAGSYFAVGIDDGRDLAYGDPAVLKPYLASAQSFTVGQGTPPQLNIAVQKRIA